MSMIPPGFAGIRRAMLLTSACAVLALSPALSASSPEGDDWPMWGGTPVAQHGVKR
jgi:hypothetical protein